MYLLILLIAWIIGIATMGHIFNEELLSRSPYIHGLSLILICLSFFRLKCLKKTGFQVFMLALISLSVFFLGQYYAQSALQKRLELRVTAVEESTQIVYIHKLNELNEFDGKQGVKQAARVATLSSKAQMEILLYLKESTPSQALQLGQYYKVSGRIKPVHSYAMPHVFDQEKWLIQHNIMGSLQVKNIEKLTPAEVQAQGYANFVHRNSNGFNPMKIEVEKQRLNFRQYIQKSPLNHKGLLLALLTGDESLLSASVKTQFRTLGISHLLAISGPHVLIFAVMFCFVFNQIVARFCPHIFQRIPRPYLLILPFITCVMLYTAFVGFEIPALRTCLSVVLFSLALLLKQHIHALKLLLLSASLLLLLDPFSILSAAFWLSYGACFILIRVYQTMLIHQRASTELKLPSWRTKIGSFLKVLFESQWKVFLALFPVVVLIFQQISWIAPWVNLVAIPIIGLIVVPLEVIGACLSMIFEPLGWIFFSLADGALSFLFWVLNILQRVFQPQLTWLSLSGLSIFMLAIGIFILFLPRHVLPKSWAIICFIPLLINPKHEREFALTVLDVGQGQAIHVQIGQQQMLIDTGGYYDETKFSIGRQLMLPYLMAEGISSLDHVYLTHLDQDHAGAFADIAQVIQIQQVLSNERDQRFQQMNFNYCHAGQSTQYKGITLQVLAPEQANLAYAADHKNELSCVIYIQVPTLKGNQNFLIMGDTGWQTEYELLQKYPELKVDVLILGHHGSQHSSSYDFLQRLHPQLAIASAGFANRYHHPHPLVKARLAALSIPFVSTIEQGSIRFEMDKKGNMQQSAYRDTRQWLQRRLH